MINNNRYIELISMSNATVSINGIEDCNYMFAIYTPEVLETIDLRAFIDGEFIDSETDPSNFTVSGEPMNDYGFVVEVFDQHIRYSLDSVPDTFGLFVKNINDTEYTPLSTVVASECQDSFDSITTQRYLFDPYGPNGCCGSITNASISLSRGYNIENYTPYRLINNDFVSVNWSDVIIEVNGNMPFGYVLVILENGIDVLEAQRKLNSAGILPSRVA